MTLEIKHDVIRKAKIFSGGVWRKEQKCPFTYKIKYRLELIRLIFLQ